MSRLFFSALLLVLTAALGCGGKVVIDDGSSAADGGTVVTGTCDEACARVAAACGQDLATCTQGCEANAANAESNGCKDLNDQLVTCIVEAPDEVACGPQVPPSCQSLYDAWSACGP